LALVSIKVILHWYHIRKRAFCLVSTRIPPERRNDADVRFAVGFEVALYYSFDGEPAGE